MKKEVKPGYYVNSSEDSAREGFLRIRYPNGSWEIQDVGDSTGQTFFISVVPALWDRHVSENLSGLEFLGDL